MNHYNIYMDNLFEEIQKANIINPHSGYDITDDEIHTWMDELDMIDDLDYEQEATLAKFIEWLNA